MILGSNIADRRTRTCKHTDPVTVLGGTGNGVFILGFTRLPVWQRPYKGLDCLGIL